MFNVGDLVVYGNNGVCEVVEITTMDLKGVDDAKLYYRLAPVENKVQRIFTPVENGKVVIREILTEEQAKELVEQITTIEPIDVPDDKQREEIYKTIVRECVPERWIGALLTLNRRKQERIAIGKKITSMDDRYIKQIENALYQEIAVSLNIEKAAASEMVRARIEKNDL